MNKKEIADKALENILYSVAPQAEDDIIESLLDDYNGEEIEYSLKHVREMQKLFKKERQKNLINKLPVIAKRIAIIIIIIVIGATISIMTVEAWRVKVFNLIMDVNKTNSDINFDDTSDGSSYNDDDISFDYIPSGFEIKVLESTDDNLFISFSNDSGEYFNVEVNDISSRLSIDTESSENTEIIINGQKAKFSFRNHKNVLVWNNDKRSISLSGNIEKSELVKIAEKIKKY